MTVFAHFQVKQVYCWGSRLIFEAEINDYFKARRVPPLGISLLCSSSFSPKGIVAGRIISPYDVFASFHSSFDAITSVPGSSP